MTDEPTKGGPRVTVEVPEGLLEVARVDKATQAAEKLMLYYQSDLERALAYELTSPTALNFGSLLAAVKEDIGNNQQLQVAVKSSPGTLISSLLFAAQCKLLPGARYKKLYLIPRKMGRKRAGGGWDKVPEVTAMLGYHGIAEMIQRCPRVHSCTAEIVYEGEEFEYERGTGRLHHPRRFGGNRSDDKIVGAYAKVVITEPSGLHPVHDHPIVWAMDIAEILKIRERSDAYQGAEKEWDGKPARRDSPWHTDFAAMVRKTPLRAIGSNGSVPLDMGTGGLLARDSEADIEHGDVIPLPRPTRAAEIREHLGMQPSQPAEPFELVEDAVEAIRAAKTRGDLEALAPRWAHFDETGSDAEQVALAYQEKLAELGGV
jgi:phage RecT family recombinase